MRDAGYKTFLRASGIWVARAPGPPIMGLKLTKAGLMPVVHGAVFSPLQNPNLKDGPKENPSPSGLVRKLPTLLNPKRTAISLSWPTILLHRPCTYSDNRSTLQKVPGKSEKDGLG